MISLQRRFSKHKTFIRDDIPCTVITLYIKSQNNLELRERFTSVLFTLDKAQGAWLRFRISSRKGAAEYTPLQLEALTSQCRLHKCSKQFISIL